MEHYGQIMPVVVISEMAGNDYKLFDGFNRLQSFQSV
jgi:hypothetical protein